jgi:hypothetical protein
MATGVEPSAAQYQSFSEVILAQIEARHDADKRSTLNANASSKANPTPITASLETAAVGPSIGASVANVGGGSISIIDILSLVKAIQPAAPAAPYWPAMPAHPSMPYAAGFGYPFAQQLPAFDSRSQNQAQPSTSTSEVSTAHVSKGILWPPMSLWLEHRKTKFMQQDGAFKSLETLCMRLDVFSLEGMKPYLGVKGSDALKAAADEHMILLSKSYLYQVAYLAEVDIRHVEEHGRLDM